MIMKERNTVFGRTLAVLIVIYAFIVTYIDGHLKNVPNIHTYVLIPISLFAVFCFVYYLRDRLRVSVWIIPVLIYGLNVSIRYIVAGTQDMLAIWGCLLILIIIAESIRLHDSFPYWIVLAFGYLQFSSMIVQMVFPSFFDDYLAVIFKNNESIVAWSHSYGFSGLSFQVEFASLSLIFSEGYCLAKLFDGSLQKKAKYVYLLQFVLFVIAIALTGKRGTFAIAVVIPLIMLIIEKRTRKIGLIIALIGLLSALAFAFILVRFESAFQGNYLLERLSRSVVSLIRGDDFSSGRLSLWRKALDVFYKFPLFGAGMHTYWYYSGTGMDPHNTYLETLSEQGIFGFILLVSLFIVCLVKTVQLKNKCNGTTAFALSFSLFIQLEQILNSFVENSMTTNIIELMMYLCAIAVLNSAAVTEREKYFTIHIGFFDRSRSQND